MMEPAERWERFAKLDAAVTLLTAIALWGVYGYCLVKLYDFSLLGMMVAFFMDICGIAAASIAAAVLLFAWLRKKSVGILVGTVFQLLYGVPYGGFLLTGRADGFITPGMVGGVLMLVMGGIGLIFWFSVPREDWQ